MIKSNQRMAYILYLIVTSIVTVCLALGWYMSPLGLGFAAWPESNRTLLEYVYAGSYYIGIPAIVIAQIVSPVLFKYGRRKVAYWLPTISIILFLTCVILILSSLR